MSENGRAAGGRPMKLGRDRSEQEKRRQAEAARNLFYEWQLLNAKEKINEKPLMNKVSERRQVAFNLSRILDELEARNPPIRKRDVLHAADQGGPNDSTKRLERFALNPDKFNNWPEEKQRKRERQLTQDIRKYVRIAQAAAEKAQEEKDRFIPELLEGTRFWTLPSTRSDNRDGDTWDEAWDVIEMAVKDISDRVCTRHNLEGFFSISHFGLKDGISTVSGPRWRFGLPRIVADDELPRRPSISLGEVTAFRAVPLTVDAHLGWTDGDRAEELRAQLLAAGLKTYSFAALAHPSYHIALDLLPSGGDGSVSPVIRLSSYTEIRAAKPVDAYACVDGGVRCPEGGLIGSTFGGLNTQDYLSIDDNDLNSDLPCAVFYEHDNIAHIVHLRMYADCDDSAFEQSGYLNSMHARIPENHSLMLPFGADAREYLEKPLSELWLDRWQDTCRGLCERFCHATAWAISDHDGDYPAPLESPKLTAFGSRTMASVLEASIFHAPEYAKIETLLDDRARELGAELQSFISQWEDKRRRYLKDMRV